MDASLLRPVRPILVAATLILVAAISVYAADTGSISGTVFDQTGMPVADATVRLSGDRLAAGRAVSTGATGAFRFDFILPGDYVVEVTSRTAGSIRRPAVVELGKDTQIDVVVGVAVAEEITVTATRPIVDVQR